MHADDADDADDADIADLAAFDLGALRRAVGSATFDRGARYARAGNVLEVMWDPDEQEVIARVLGSRAPYDTLVVLAGRPGAMRYEYSECSCPVGYDCKHGVAALATIVERAASARRTPATEPALAARAGVRAPKDPDWLQRIREFAPSVRPSSGTGRPLAIELSVPAAGSGVRKKLRARVMRQGKSKWVNDNLTWGVDRGWQLSATDFRPDHLDVVRSIQVAAATAERLRTTYRFSYYGSGAERELDLTTIEADVLWPLLDAAADVGIELIHTTPSWGPVPRVDTGELCLDVVGHDITRVTPLLHLDGQPLAADVTTLAFIGESGGAVVTSSTGSNAAPNRDQPLVLVRLARPVPMPLQRMLLAAEHIEIPADEADRFVSEAWPTLAAAAPVISSDGSFTPPRISGPELLLTATFGQEHQLGLTWTWRYEIDGAPRRYATSERAAVGDLRDPPAEAALLA